MTQQKITFYVTLFGIFIFSWWLQSGLLIRSDVSILMHETMRFLEGGTYLKDFYEPDPPLIFFLNIPPVLFIKYFHIKSIIVIRLYIFAIALSVLAICYSFFKKILENNDSGLADFLLLILAILFLILPLGDFGQRDHLVFIFSLPYLLLLTLRLQNKPISHRSAIGIGLLGAIGFAIKPHYLAVFILVELYYVFYRRKWQAFIRSESITLYVFMLVYLLSIYIFFPTYIYGIVPLVSRIYYSGMGTPWLELIFYPTALYCALSVLFYWVQYSKNREQALSTILLLSVIGFLIAYLLQDTARYYHILPALSASLLLTGLLGWLLVSQASITKKEVIDLGLLGGVYFVFLLTFKQTIWISIIFFPVLFFSFFAFLFILLLYASRKNIFSPMLMTLFIVSLGIGFTYFAKRTDWFSHRFFLTISLMLLIFTLFTRREQRANYLFYALLGMAILAYPFYEGEIIYSYYSLYAENSAPLIQFLQKNASNQSVYFISGQLSAYPFIDYANVNYASKYPLLIWVLSLPHLNNNEKNYYIDSVADELMTRKPAWVFVDSATFAFDKTKYDFIKNFSANTKFRQAWEQYEYTTAVDNKPMYRLSVYKRKQKEN